MIDLARELSRLLAPLTDARGYLDLHAQLEMARWAYWMFWAAIGGAIFSLVAIVLAFLSWRTSKAIGETQTQAYVHASAAIFGQSGNILVSCKNSGLTPATHFALNAVAKIVPQGHVTESITFENHNFKIWSSLGAGEVLTASVLEGSPLVAEFLKGPREGKRLLISGQILYCTVFGHDYLTQFAFYVEPRTLHRFRRPTANLVAFWRVKGRILKRPRPSVAVTLENDEGAFDSGTNTVLSSALADAAKS